MSFNKELTEEEKIKLLEKVIGSIDEHIKNCPDCQELNKNKN